MAIILISLLCSAFFSGMEIAFVSANRIHIEIEKKQGGPLGKVLTRLTARPSKFITTMLIGNNIALVVYAYYMGEWLVRWFQGMLPSSSRIMMTLVAGAVATLAGAFPNLSAKLLDFVGLYGTVLGPMGAVIFVDFWLLKKWGLVDEYAHRTRSTVHPAVLIA